METLVQRTVMVEKVLKYTYGLVPIVAGLDKYTNLLTDWKKYISGSVADILPISPVTFMHIVGIIEMVAGLLVLVRPRIGAWVVTGWLVVIALSLILGGHFFDVAVRDLVMAVGAFALVKLSGSFDIKSAAVA